MNPPVEEPRRSGACADWGSLWAQASVGSKCDGPFVPPQRDSSTLHHVEPGCRQVAPTNLPQPDVRSRQAGIDLDGVILAAILGDAQHQIDAHVPLQAVDAGDCVLGETHRTLPEWGGQSDAAATVAEATIVREVLCRGHEWYGTARPDQECDAGGRAGDIRLDHQVAHRPFARGSLEGEWPMGDLMVQA